MKFLDALLGRTRPVRPNLDVLFAIPAAAIALRAGLDLAATGSGGVCFRTAEGGAAARAEADALELSRVDSAGRAEIVRDSYAYTWVTFRRADADLSALVTDLHAVNTTLAEAGFGSGLLCTLIGFASADGHRRVGLVYLFKRGTVYPFAPIDGERRDNELELAVRAQLTGELPLEGELSRWFPLWSAPPLRP
jgi:hypothetical protein